MAAFPGAKVHRHNRRKLGRGQVPSFPATAITVTGSASTMKIVTAAPVVFEAAIPVTVATLTIVSQTVVSQTEVDILMSGTVATHAWTVPQGAGTNFAGGVTAAGSGTF